jgi:post-segregation antitoxin (ccd killing protein)
MQVYLPDDLYTELKAHDLPASELLQQAVRRELRRRALLEETDRYVEELVAETGAPTARDLAAAEELVARLARGGADSRAG